jgi:hypothetical protein
MNDRGSCSRVTLDGRRIVVDLSDADLTRLDAIGTRRGVDGAELVLEWIRRGLGARDRNGPSDRPSRPERVARDVEVARQAEELFGDLLGDHDHSD